MEFIKSIKNGKYDLDEALAYFTKLADLRRKNVDVYEHNLFHDIFTEVTRTEDEDKSKSTTQAEKRAKIIDSLIEQTKQKSGGDVQKEKEYRNKIINDVFKALYITDYPNYKDLGNKDNVEWLGIESTKKEEPTQTEDEKKIYREEVPIAVKFIQEFKEGKMELDKALDYLGKLSGLREKNEKNFTNFIYYEMGTEIEKPRPEDVGKERINARDKERALIIDSLVEQAKKLSGGDPVKENEYKEKIKRVFSVLGNSYNKFGFYEREGNKDNIAWLGVKTREESDRMFG